LTLPLAEIARRLGKKRGTVYAAANRNAFLSITTEGNRLAELEDVKHYFENNRNSKKKT
jgi:hypothetical protein